MVASWFPDMSGALNDRLRAAVDESLVRRSSAPAAVTSEGVWTYGDLARLLPALTKRPALVRTSDRSVHDLVFVVAALLAGRPFHLVPPSAGASAEAQVFAERAVADSAAPAEVAYAIRSSGTTSGVPSLHLVSRRSLGMYVDGAVDRLQVAERSSFAICTPLWYDLSYTALFCALAVGGCLHMLSEATCASPRLFDRYLRSHDVGYLKITPSLFSALRTTSSENAALPTTGVIFGGEPLPWWLVEGLVTSPTRTPRIFNHYGPAEITVGACAGEVPQDRGDTATVPIGTPLRHVHAAVDGTASAGELVLSGPQVTENLGLAGSESDTYRTRDLVRALPDGSYEFLGRTDRKVKIRGEFMDLAEVERLVRLLPGVAHVSARTEAADIPEQVIIVVRPVRAGCLDRMDVYRHLESLGCASLCQSVVRITDGSEMHESGKSK